MHDALGRAEERVRGRAAYELHERPGNPAREILRFCEGHEGEPSIMGGRGRGRGEGFFLGSVSQEIMEKAPGTVLVVK